ncbi:MAG: tRNA (guanosine(37)-N1)-methyltransferase TrmD [Patescibacteria group bacterium]
MKINVLTLFPDYFQSVLKTSILGKAVAKKQIEINLINIRDFATDKHQTTDERPYGGGPGMVMKVEPIAAALKALGQQGQKGKANQRIILTSADGQIFDQAIARDFAKLDSLTIICGHYEGVDQRVTDLFVDEEIRIGNFVLTGGEPAAAVMIDAVSRLIPGVLGNELSNKDESHAEPGRSAFPQYTRPEIFSGKRVPKILLTGNHAQISQWREKNRVPVE